MRNGVRRYPTPALVSASLRRRRRRLAGPAGRGVRVRARGCGGYTDLRYGRDERWEGGCGQ